MAEHGGRRTPRKPAPVSGPGRLSRRTDGGPQQVQADLPNAAYGEQAAYQEAQSAAPMAASPQQAGSAVQPQAPRRVNVVPLGADSMRPDEPITAGAALGAGPGLDALGLGDPTMQVNEQDMQQLKAYLPYLEWMVGLGNTSPGLRRYVRNVKGMLRNNLPGTF